MFLGALVLFVGSALTAPKVQEHVIVAQGSANTPEFVVFVHDQGAEVAETQIEDVADAVRKGKYSSILVFPQDFAEAFGDERNAEIQIYIDSSRLSSIMSIRRTAELINRFNRSTADSRLAAHEVDPEIAYPVPHWQFMLGKYIALLVFTVMAILTAIVAYKVIFSGLGMLGVGIKVNPGLGDFTIVFICASRS